MNRADLTSPSLLHRAAGHDQVAWRRLAELYRPLVVHWCRAAGVAVSEVDDVVQETLIAVSAGLPAFRRDRPGSFRAWIRGIARHKALDHHRRAGRSPNAAGGTEAQLRLQGVSDPDVSDDSHTDAQEAAWVYRRALELVRAEFTEQTWNAFWKSVVDGLSTDSVAAELGMSPVAVRVAKSRVLGRLRAEAGELLD